jgi:hypothetical protein
MQICLINLFRPFLEKKSPGKRKFFIRKNCGSLAHIAFSKRKSFAKQKFFWQPAFSWTMQNQKGFARPRKALLCKEEKPWEKNNLLTQIGCFALLQKKKMHGDCTSPF